MRSLFFTGWAGAAGLSRRTFRRARSNTFACPNFGALDGADQFAAHWRLRLCLCWRLFACFRGSSLSKRTRCKQKGEKSNRCFHAHFPFAVG